MKGAPFEADFDVLEFSGANAILGVQWLEGLGRVVTHHKALTMEFEHQGRPEALSKDPFAQDTIKSLHMGDKVDSDSTPLEATWEYWEPFHATYPHIILEDKAVFDGEGNVTNYVEDLRTKRVVKPPVKLQDYICA
nr:hypothetical protein CISIN_1g044180mg [Ipomoea trifida]